MIKMMLDESPGVRIRREDPGEHDGRIEAHEEPHNAASLASSKSFCFCFSRENSLFLVEIGALALAIASRRIGTTVK